MWGETSAKSGEGVAEIFGSIGEPNPHLLSVPSIEISWLARKLPLTAPPPASARAAAAGAKRGVDLNKTPGGVGAAEGCNC